MTTEKSIIIGTDVAALFLFHPDDLVHRKHDPLYWYSFDFAFRKESAAGRLIVFSTGGDGRFLVRLTTGELTEAEAAGRCPSWTFPLVVRYSRILLDNTDHLPSENQVASVRCIPDMKERWFEVPIGAYRVTVTPIALRDGGSGDAARAEIPDYVIQFDRVQDLTGIPVAPYPPDLRASMGCDPFPFKGGSEAAYCWPQKSLSSLRYPALVVPDQLAILPGQAAHLTVDRGLGENAFRQKEFVVAPSFAAGALAIVASPVELAHKSDGKSELTIIGRGIVKIMRRPIDQPPLSPIEVRQIDKPDMSGGDPKATAVVKARLLCRLESDLVLRARLKHPSLDTERLVSLNTPEAVTTWALMYLDLSFSERVEAYAYSVAERLNFISEYV